MKYQVLIGKSVFSVLVVCLVGMIGANAFGQFLPDPIQLDSFESLTGISDWAPDHDYVPIEGPDNNIYISHSQSTTGVTHGSKSLALELNTATGWGVTLTAANTDTDLALYNAFNTVAQDPTAWYLEGDLTLDATSWANVSAPAVPPFQGLFQFNLALNDDGGFAQEGATADLYDQIIHVPFRVSVNDLDPLADSSYYQLFLGGSGVFQTGGTPEAPLGAIAYLDNLRFTPAPPSVPVTLFSWETPAGGNGEEFEGWSDCGLGCMADPPSGHTGTHLHTIINNSPAATDGTHLLRIDNTRQNDPNLVPDGFKFYWGSTMQLNSNTAPDGEDPIIDPEIQAQIDYLRETFNSASAIAFDVHFEDLFNGNAYDPFSPSPTFVRFAVALVDGTGTWFQAEGTALPGTPDANEGDTFEYIIGTNIMTDVTTDKGILSQSGLEATNSLGIIFAVNANGGLLADIDNFRVMIEIDLNADFDNDGDVDDDDLVVWQNSYGVDDAADANGDGVTDGQDFLYWQKTFGNDATQSVVTLSSEDLALLGLTVAVPEPLSVALLVLGLVAGGCGRTTRFLDI